MIPRHIKKVVDYSIKHYPCVIITGARQVGKTTLLSNEYANKGFTYVSLDNSADRKLAKNDPKSFLELHPHPLIIDEVQKAPELFPEIEYIINEKRRKEGHSLSNGLFILTGSSRKELLEQTKESLAGRVALINMSTLSLSEIHNRGNIPFEVNSKNIVKRSSEIKMNQSDLLDLIVKGELPGLYDDPKLRKPIFYDSYISTYLEKDVREQVALKDELKFREFLTLVASNTGQELVYENIARMLSVSANTIKIWIKILERGGIVYLLQPYFEYSWNKRIVKRPKLYFFDTGVACFLLGIDSKETLNNSFLKGALFETFIINEIRKTYLNDGEETKLYYYRDSYQKEVDLVLVKSGSIHAIEIKFGKEHNLNDVKSFKELSDSKLNKGKGGIICTIDSLSALKEDILLIPFTAI